MKQSIHETLKGLRLDKHVTQEQAAEAIGVTVNTIQNWESGRSVPTSVNLRALCDYYKCETLSISPQEESKDELVEFPAVLFEYDYASLLRLLDMKLTSAEQELFSYLVVFDAIPTNLAGRIVDAVEIAKIPVEIIKKYSPSELLVTSRNIVQKLKGAKLESVVKWLQLSEGRTLDANKGTREQIEIVLRDFGFFKDDEASEDMKQMGHDYCDYDSEVIHDVLAIIVSKPYALCYKDRNTGTMYLSEEFAFLHERSYRYVWRVLRNFDGLLWHINYVDVSETCIDGQEEYDHILKTEKFRVSEFLSFLPQHKIETQTVNKNDVSKDMYAYTVQVTPIGARMFMWLLRHPIRDRVRDAEAAMYPEKWEFYQEEIERFEGCYEYEDLKNLKMFEFE